MNVCPHPDCDTLTTLEFCCPTHWHQLTRRIHRGIQSGHNRARWEAAARVVWGVHSYRD